MPTAFAEAWADAQADFDATLGGMFRLLPRRRPMRPEGRVDVNGEASPDPSRPEVSFFGRYSEKAKDASAEGRGKAGNWTTGFSSLPPRLRAPADVFGPSPPRSGDLVRREEGGDLFTVAEVTGPDQGRYAIELIRGAA